MNEVDKPRVASGGGAKCILIVDETGGSVSDLAKTLTAAGYDITIADDEKAAEQALARHLTEMAVGAGDAGPASGVAVVVVKKSGHAAVVCAAGGWVESFSRPDETLLSALEESFDRMRSPRDWAVAEADRRQTEGLLRAILENATAVIYAKDREGRYLFVNKRFEEIFGLADGAIKGKLDHEIFPVAFADAYHRNDLQVLHSGHPLEIEEVAPHADGPHTYLSIKFPLFDELGAVRGVCGISTDVTEHKRATERLRRAQHLEAIGQLTGGIAHDFNNLNAVILGNLELLEEELEVGTPESKMVQRAVRAAQRGSTLIERLLAFSRKQVLQPRRVDVNALVQTTADFLRRGIGENIDIRTILGKELWPAFVDSSQLENTIIDLAVNARDAMPKGGVLSIETRKRHLDEYESLRAGKVMPGDYIELVVKDTGTGIDPAIKDRVFEPFYTTKEAGGAGLGLSMVHGFVTQSGGHVSLDSGPGGTTVTILLPRAGPDAIDSEDESRKVARSEAKPGETILVVEDDAEVRRLTATFLKSLGYSVLEAGDAAAALALLRGAPVIDLLLTDVVLPGRMGGRDLAMEICAKHPETPILFMSGYADPGLTPDDLTATGARLIDKPFSRSELTAAVRACIDAAAVGPRRPRMS